MCGWLASDTCYILIGRKGKDKYGRWLGVVYISGASVNVEMVEKGYAVKYEEGGD